MKRYILLHFLISIIITVVYGNNCDDTYNAGYTYGFPGDYGTNLNDEDYGGCFLNYLPGNQYDNCDDAINNPLPIDSQWYMWRTWGFGW